MRNWKPRAWPLTPHLAREYACVDARPLARLQYLPGILGLRLTGRGVGIRASSGNLGLIDTALRVVEPGRRATFLARLPANAARVVGFDSSAYVLRSAWREPAGIVMDHFTDGAGRVAERTLLIDPSWIVGKLVALMDSTAREWSTWKQIEVQLARALTNKPGVTRLTLEAADFEQLRAQLEAALRVYNIIEQPSDIVSRTKPFLKELTPLGRREFRDAVRCARQLGMSPRDLAAVGGEAR